MESSEVEGLSYQRFGQFLERQCGIVLGDNKQYLVKSRLMPLVRAQKMSSVNHLIDKVVDGHDSRLKEDVLDAMTTNETTWFRDVYPYDILKDTLFNEFSSLSRPLRIWSAACSSGQEPYSIAMTFLEYQRSYAGNKLRNIEIVGTDISADMLQRASSAEYDQLSLSRGLSEERKRMFFDKQEGDTLKLKSDVTRLVKFKPINLIDPYVGLGKFDIVFCRNVLIYFSQDVKRKILQQIAAGLQDNGVLFLGASESISSLSDDFTMMRCSPGLYYRKKVE